MNKAKIMVGNALDTLKTLEVGSIQTCVTSPPYWGLRDYGNDDQLGLESTPSEFVENLCKVFDEVWRVLADDGTVWVNLGDSYAGASLSRASDNGRAGYGKPREGTFSRLGEGLKHKDLVGIPWRFAFAMQDRGWYLRQDIIWAKPNPMPESVTDRCTKSHEYIFLLTKNPRYFFDNESIREPLASSSLGRISQDLDNQTGSSRAHAGAKSNGNMKAFGDAEAGRNKRSVWNVGVASFKDAHFAVYPPALIEPCVKAGSAEGDTVLDPFSGSGTTGEVALKLGRNYVGCELNPEYARLSEKRLVEALGMFADVEVLDEQLQRQLVG
jgi:DNA modification methylase